MLTLEQEQVIIEESKKDIQSFRILYEENFSRIYAYVWHMVGDKVKAEDIVSQTFENAIKNLSKYESRGYRFSSWLYAIARNCVNKSGKVKEQVSLNEEIYLENETTDDVNVNDQEVRKDALYKALQHLGSVEREIVILRYIEGFSIAEVSKMLGKSEDSVKSHCKRSLDSLKEIISDMTHFI